MNLSITHLLILLGIALVIFGTKRLTSGLSSGARDLGKAINEFKKGVSGDDESPAQLSDQTKRDANSESQRNDDHVAR